MELSCAVRYNEHSPSVKRLMREALEIKEASEDYFAQPLENDLFEWHFTIKGPSETDFEHGFYHGRIVLPPDYPMSPPAIMMLTPNGRFETNKKICLSVSGYHPETWQPSWSIRTLLLALIAFMPTPANGNIGSLDYSAEERKLLATRSRYWECQTCGRVADHFKQLSDNDHTPEMTPQETEYQGNTSVEVVALEVPVESRSPRDNVLLFIMWVLLTIIFALLYRRIFVF